MEHKIITTAELYQGINLTKEEYKYLIDLFDLDDEDFEEFSLFEGDPDFIKVNGEQGRGEIPFISVNVNGTEIYILSNYYLDCYDCEQEASEILEWFIMGAENKKEIMNVWEDWDKVKEGIAYRGGAGYFYSLFAKELI